MNTENNKLIAEFMGYIDNGCSEEGFLICPKTNYDVDINDLKYHSDWNWLMEVVEKIESEGFSIEMNRQEEGDYQCLITKGNDIKFQTFSSMKIEAVYNACVEFIKWYNEQK